jgi:hypothetical protein
MADAWRYPCATSLVLEDLRTGATEDEHVVPARQTFEAGMVKRPLRIAVAAGAPPPVTRTGPARPVFRLEDGLGDRRGRRHAAAHLRRRPSVLAVLGALCSRPGALGQQFRRQRFSFAVDRLGAQGAAGVDLYIALWGFA